MDANETEDACVQNDGKNGVLYGVKTWAVKEEQVKNWRWWRRDVCELLE